MEAKEEPGKSRVALIAGGVRGIGRAVALALAKRGWTVAACYRSNEAAAAELESMLRAIGAIGMVQGADVSVPQNAESLVRQVEEEYGRIDALINCIGAYHRVHLMQESLEGWHSMFDNNLHPVFYFEPCRGAGNDPSKMGTYCQLQYGECRPARGSAVRYRTLHR